MTSTAPLIDLDAARRETQHPDGISVLLGGHTFTLPAEIPFDIFEPLLSEDLGLVEIVTGVFADREQRRKLARMNDEPLDENDETIVEDVVKVLGANPALPRQTRDAILATFEVLFGAEQWALFLEQRPSVSTLLRLGRALLPMLLGSLGEAFASSASSESAGATPKPTSKRRIKSTSVESSSAPDSPAS